MSKKADPAAVLVPVDKITVPEGRHRKDFGDLEAFAQSIHKRGLLQPLVLDDKYVLHAGERRLLACRDVLKWREIPCRVVPPEQIDALLIEHAENEDRKDFTISEKVAICKAIRDRMGDGRFAESQGDIEGLRTDAAAKIMGVSRSTFQRADKAIRSGSKELIKAMDEELIPPRLAAQAADLPKTLQNEVVKKIRQGERPGKALDEATRDREEKSDADEALPEVDREPDASGKDARGATVPANLRDSFGSMMLENVAEGQRMFLKTLHNVARWNPYLQLADIQQYLKLAVDMCLTAKPYAVCEKCRGKEGKVETCRNCRCSGFLTENAWAEKHAQGEAK